jgi:hypothetical protein
MKNENELMKIKTEASQLKITRLASTPNISKTINAHTNDDHLFYQILLGLRWLFVFLIVHHHCSNLIFIIDAHTLIVNILIKA